MHAGQRECGTVVDVEDAGVGVGAAQHPGVQHAAQFDVVGEGRVAASQLDAVDLQFGLADDGHLRHIGGEDEARHRRRHTGSCGGGLVGGGILAVGERRQDGGPEWHGGLAAHHAGGSLHRLDGLHVRGLAVEHAR